VKHLLKAKTGTAGRSRPLFVCFSKVQRLPVACDSPLLHNDDVDRFVIIARLVTKESEEENEEARTDKSITHPNCRADGR
jgi:hypothetical protein